MSLRGYLRSPLEKAKSAHDLMTRSLENQTRKHEADVKRRQQKIARLEKEIEQLEKESN